MTLAEFKTRVRMKVDEYTPDGVTHPLDDFIEPMINEAAKRICDEAPKYLFEPAAIEIDTEGAGLNTRWENDTIIIDLPSSYARLYEALFPSWNRSVFKEITPEDPEHERQQNEYLKAGYGRPVVILKTSMVEGDLLAKTLVCGKVVDGVEPTVLTYIGYKDAEDLPDVLDEAVTWLAASMILQELGYGDRSTACLQQYISQITDMRR